MMVALECLSSGNGPHNSFAASEFRRLRECQADDRFRVHTLVDDVEQADIVIFLCMTSTMLFDVLRSPIWRKRPEKCFVLCSSDRGLPLLPGLYASLELRFHSKSWTRSTSYLRVAENENIDCSAPFERCDLLYFFSGAIRNHSARSGLLELDHDRGIVNDTSSLSVQERQRDGKLNEGDTYISSYLSLLARSKFVLCPRGAGSSSWRLFETMKAGRVPVIISDQWVPPEGPAWNEFSVRIPESQVANIPRELERLERDAPILAWAARQAWEEWFARDVIFHRIVEWCLAIRRNRTAPLHLRSTQYALNLARPFYFRYWLLPEIKRLVVGRG